jgi:cell division initiation protein
MSLSPAEIRHAEIGRGLFGYKRATVDDLLDEIVESFEQVWRERADLTDKVEQLEADLVRYRELESLLRTTLVSAERASHELREQARKEAELIVSEAQSEARRVTRDARSERERLAAESHRIRAVLRAALDTIEEEASAPKAEPTPKAEAA